MTTRGERFDPGSFEQRWRDRWEADELYRADDADPRQKHYLLTMYPYPSGDLHIGHWYAATGPDIVARMRRMQGLNVMFPMGFDSFGLPAENAAIDRGVHPARLDGPEHRAHARASSGPPAAASIGTARSSSATRVTTGGPSGSSCSSTRPGWPTRPWRRSTGARRTRWSWPASRWRAPTAIAGAVGRRWSSATWSSGSSASPTTPMSCSTSPGSTGRSRSG